VHTDDIAWAHSRLGWEDLMISGVLESLHRGELVDYKAANLGAPQHVDASPPAPLVIIGGVGAARRELSSGWRRSDAV
jgi:hypothetical protein